jgi:hypothetical protein
MPTMARSLRDVYNKGLKLSSCVLRTTSDPRACQRLIRHVWINAPELDEPQLPVPLQVLLISEDWALCRPLIIKSRMMP